MSQELISVLIPVYNVEQYLAECVNSVRNQTYQNLEIILVNDGSTDASGQICRDLAAQDSRITVMDQENQGLSGARNTGLEAAGGAYVIFVDSDDWLPEQHVARLYEKLKEYDADIAIGHHCSFRPEDATFLYYSTEHFEQLYKREEMIEEYPRRRMMDGVFLSAWGKLYKRDLFDAVRYPVGRVAEDAFTTYKLYLQAEKIIYLNEPLYYYRLRPGSISLTWNERWFQDLIAGFEEQLAILGKLGYDLSFYYKYYTFLLQYCRDNALAVGLQDSPVYQEIENKLKLFGE
ncbi:glycosyltransferase family 2 protein [Streptococcus panodentis]|uniref:Glycosyltransferase family 2 protein n=1 Tax=Streptococcus panodentis TaxID=1581472 RepID=A0ABS5AZT5_9STRE|nr:MULTISPECIES: glycosyltransferase family 2 protein [Streptococcus]KXT83400.1 Beta-1,3-glucosyltransferase [Streptococcus sp. DD11]MBP2621936.1 glycosyltransferase family 2 protein [Streptococcus panodentis]